jgi:hypothetical protein
MKPTWKKYLLYGGVIVVGGILLFLLEETIRYRNTGFEGKTLWEWMELLVIPVFLAGGALYLERSERVVDRKTAEDRAKREQQAAEDRAKLERELATDRQQEAALQAYLDRMAELLLKEKQITPENEAVWNVARVRTLTVIRGLDAVRNGMVLRFLGDIGLTGKKSQFFVRANLQYAKLQGVDLTGTNLQDANLEGVHLEGAFLYGVTGSRMNLKKANLEGAFLLGANLEGADLQSANLEGAILVNANLKDASLYGANLYSAKVMNEQLANVRFLEGATMPDGTIHD